MIPALAAHVPILAMRSGAIARCFLISTTQAAPGLNQSWRVTDAPCPVQVQEGDGLWYEYVPTIGIEADSTERVAQLGKSSTVISVSTQDDASFDADDARRGLLDSALVYEFDVDWRYPWLPPIRVFRWRVSDYDPEANRVRLTLVGMSQDLAKDAGHSFAPGCFNEFGDARCDAGGSITANSNFRYRLYQISSGTTPSRKSFSVIEETDTFPAASTAADDWWGRGLVNFTSGRCQGLRVIVYGNTAPSGAPLEMLVTLTTPLPFAPSIGDTIQMRVGCDKKRGTCLSKFSNLNNFNGFDFQPGSDSIRKTPESR